ncbi:MAG: glycosyltransferase family 39 protein [Phycisphaerales bacterium]
MSRPSLRDLAIVLSAAFTLRLLAVLTLPLIITNDGAFYLLWGTQIADGTWPDLPATRTPGYPMLLGIMFAMLDQSAAAVLIVQHTLGAATAALAWWIGRSIGGRFVALAGGLLVALDPWLLGLSSFALSETPSVALALCAVALAAARPRGWRLVLAGLAIGAAVLVRPSMLAWIPGLLLIAFAHPAERHRSRVLRPGLLAAAAALTLAPWLAFNASRGVPGLARTDGLALWGGLARAGLLDPTFQLPDSAPPPPESLFQPGAPEPVVMGYYRDLGRADGVDREQVLSDWSGGSVAAQPAGYARVVGHAAAWQSNAMLHGTPYRHDGLRWAMRRLGGIDQPADGQTNFSTDHLPELLERFDDAPARGPLAWVYRRWPVGMFQCVPQLPAGVLTLAAVGMLAWRRRWVAAATLAASFPIVLGHALLLQPFARYSLSAWMLWWIGAAIAVSIAWPRAIRLVCHPVPQRSRLDCDGGR